MKRTFALIASAVAAGCTVGPDYHAPQMRVPERFAATTQPVATQPSSTQPAATQPAATQPVDLRLWWNTFNDAKLDQLIDRATYSNLDVRLAEARVREARALLEFNRGALFPMVNGTGSFTRSQSSKNAIGGFGGGGGGSGGTTTGTGTGTGGTGTGTGTGAGTGTGSGTGSSSGGSPFSFSVGRTNLYQAGFDAGWEIDVFGGTRRAIESAQYGYEAQVEARRNALVTLLSEVARNYIALRGLQHELAIVQNNIATQDDTLRLTRSKFEAGIATDLDVARQEAQVASTRAQIPTLQTQIQQAIHRLGVLMDESPAALEGELAEPGNLPSGPSVVPAGLPSELVRRRPDVRQAERRLAEATANIGVAVADLFPKFNLTGALGLESLSLKTLAASKSIFWSFGPSVNWKIFSAGQVQANIRVQDARQEEALIQYRQAVLQALSDVEDALVAYNQEQARRASLQQAVASNRRAVDLAKQLNQAGVVDFLNVLTAQQALYQSEDQLAQSEQTVGTNLVSLYKALGGGWEVTDPAIADRGRLARD